MPGMLDSRTKNNYPESFHALVMQLPAAIAVFSGPDYKLEVVNDLFEQLAGRNKNQLLNKPASQVIPENRLPKFLELMDHIRQTGQPVQLHENRTHIQRNGYNELAYLNIIFQPLKDEDDSANKIVAIITDVTKQVTARLESQESLRKIEENNDLLQLVLESGELGYYDFYPETGELIWSERTKEMYGLPPEAEVDYTIFMRGLHPDDREGVDAAIKKAMNSKDDNYETTYRTIGFTDGKTRWIRSKGKVFFDGNGNAIRFTGVTQNITRQKNIEEKNRMNEVRYRQIFEGSPVSIWEKDFSKVVTELKKLKQEHGSKLKKYLSQHKKEVERLMAMVHIKDTNEASIKMFDADNKQQLLKGLSVVFTDETLPVFIEELMAIADKKESFESEYELKTIKGREIVCLVKTKLPQNEDYSSVLVTRFDITERKKAERALEESEAFNRAILERFRGTFENAAVGIGHVGLDGKWLTVNDRLCQITGYSQNELLEKTFQDITYAPDLENDLRLMHQLLDDELSTYSIDKRYIKKNGALIWITLTCSLVRDHKGKPMYFIAVVQDTSLRKKTEDALRQSEEELRVLANGIQNLAWMADADGAIFWHNQRWDEYTGLTSQAAPDSGWQKLVHPHHISQVLKFLNEALEKREPFELTFPLRRYDGQYRWFLTRAFPIKDADGKVHRWIGTSTDIDDQKSIEEKLEHLVNERTKELQRSNEDLQQFAHVASHDLKEPVRKIRTFTSRLEQEFSDALPEQGKVYLEKVMKSGERIYQMIDGVLLYSSVDALEQAKENVDLNKIFTQILSDLEVAIREKNATIRFAKLPVISGSAFLIHQLFYNLVNNSLKFSKPGVKPLIEITCEHDKSIKKGDFVKIILQDNGLGFRPEDAKKIFQTFTRLHAKNQFEGTGLGLALCKKIVERHKGLIYAEGEPGKGAKFIIYLPVDL